jgi:hypothetical protein
MKQRKTVRLKQVEAEIKECEKIITDLIIQLQAHEDYIMLESFLRCADALLEKSRNLLLENIASYTWEDSNKMEGDDNG